MLATHGVLAGTPCLPARQASLPLLLLPLPLASKPNPQVPPPQPRVVVISGPSGVGKDAVIKRLQQLRPDLYFVVTATSR